MLNSYFLLPYILQPTRITERSATLIDNIFSNTYAANTTSGNLVLRIPDQLPQLLIVDNVKVNHKTLHYYKNDYFKFDEEKWINDFALLDWANIFNNNLYANTKFDVFFMINDDYIERRHAERVLGEELNTRGKSVWYLAHYPEKHPLEPGKGEAGSWLCSKVWINITNSWWHEAMFHQFMVDPKDCDTF